MVNFTQVKFDPTGIEQFPSKKITVYLVDFTHTGQLVASNVHPYGIGLIAAYMKEYLNDNLTIELFKYPDDLAAAVENNEPTVLDFIY